MDPYVIALYYCTCGVLLRGVTSGSGAPILRQLLNGHAQPLRAQIAQLPRPAARLERCVARRITRQMRRVLEFQRGKVVIHRVSQ